MFDKSWSEMRNLDIKKYIKKRDGLDYLPWGKCIDLLHKNGAEKVVFTPCVNQNGSSLFMSDQTFTDKNGQTNRCYEVRVHVVIDSLEFDAQFPLMNGSNPVKDNSLTQQRVWNAQCRAFVKGVAIHTGLGFSLWSEDDDTGSKFDDLSAHDLSKIKERVQQEYTYLLKSKKLTSAEIAKRLGLSKSKVTEIFTYFDQLNNFERDLLNIR